MAHPEEIEAAAQALFDRHVARCFARGLRPHHRRGTQVKDMPPSYRDDYLADAAAALAAAEAIRDQIRRELGMLDLDDDETLLPCPFCGGEAERFECQETDNQGGDVIGCKVCQASTRVFFGEREGIRDAWNSRVTSLSDGEQDRGSNGPRPVVTYLCPLCGETSVADRDEHGDPICPKCNISKRGQATA